MPQMGLHLSIGLAGTCPALCKNRSLGMGFLIGSLLPDLDFALLLPLYFVDRPLALSMHRAFSHSLVFVGILILVGLLLRLRSSSACALLLGVAVGVLLHAVLDLFLWFYPVALLWPAEDLYVYANVEVPAVALKIVYAVECVCYALFLRLLARRLGRRPTRVESLAIWGLSAVSLVLCAVAFYVGHNQFQIVAYVPALGVAFPLCIYKLFKHRLELFPRDGQSLPGTDLPTPASECG